MNAKNILNELSEKMATASTKSAIVGLDGFVDKIIKPVDSRFGQGADFEPIPTIEAFGQRIIDAAGESANIELYEEYEKLGGNGPIMANALVADGLKVQYIGALGQPMEAVFEEFAKNTNAVSICAPGITHALEFTDGKIMLGSMKGLDDLTLDRILEVMGEGAFIDAVNRADLIALVNWTMIPNMTAIFEGLLTRVLPNLGPKESGRWFYFDLADPAKRSRGDLKEVLNVISKFRSHGSVTLGLNLSEAKQVCDVFELGSVEEEADSLKSGATRIRNALNLPCVVIHPRSGAACATRDGAWYVEGPFCKSPKISTGAGDHFNSGFAAAEVIGLSPEACLMVAVATSGQYVRTGRSPSLRETARFIESWTSGSLSD
ncbi:carbohydrate kinase family protein [Puniceicoccales bacterium CK1056]|uniref:Carbohydrate kinase family protein n=1 Tax=Oceanipulchritudo coccoides TaxID=2706888 RepID=A0A6B2M403_9BACT|nr:PfkB family carbohydrate kinase [Oceanipulchritudo coccoides]NDV62827.1 carbohydrate kinase family protein [Oceanipulchritudo coccoides]